mmetsp:Transcript_34617/g.104475  ORF Transcript_34617/g.104475 Transcript_34617/m.104475 type:complete len:339 (+) Transcript_34617:200-1216(+)
MVCCSHWVACSSLAKRRSETFKRICINGSLTPACCMFCAVPGREPAVLGREGALACGGVPAREPREVAVPPSVVDAADGTDCKASAAPSAIPAAAICDTGLSSYNSKDDIAEMARRTASTSLATGLPSKSNSLSSAKSLNLPRASGRSMRFLHRSRISNEAQLVAISPGSPSTWLSARISSVNCSICGKPFKPSVVNELPATSTVAKLGKAMPPDKKDRLTNWLPASRNSSNLPKPFKCAALTSRNWFWPAARISNPLKPSTPSNDPSWFCERCNSRSLVNLAKPLPSFWIRFLLKLRYSRDRKWPKPSTAAISLSSRWRDARLTHGSKPWTRATWQL